MSSPDSRSKFVRFLGLPGWLLLVFAFAAIGGFASVSASDFYSELTRPAWAPPGWLFGPVWSALYLLMGISAWLIWRIKGFSGARVALALFVVQLVANALWTWLFFVWRQGGWAFGEILVLWGLIAIVIYLFWQVSKVAAVLLMPYLLWVSFATALNFATWQLNPALLG